MSILLTLQGYLDKIPVVIGFIRDLIIKIMATLRLPVEANFIVFFIIAMFLAYVYLKQFVTSSLWMKMSTLLNLVLLALLLYLTLTKVG